jgi:hypothetical protein
VANSRVVLLPVRECRNAALLLLAAVLMSESLGEAVEEGMT